MAGELAQTSGIGGKYGQVGGHKRVALATEAQGRCGRQEGQVRGRNMRRRVPMIQHEIICGKLALSTGMKCPPAPEP